MSKRVSKSIQEIGPGPTQIHRKPDGGEPELLGYALVEYDESNELYLSYFVLAAGTDFPLPTSDPKSELLFRHVDAPTSSPQDFYEWVIKNGELGDDVDTWQSTERYDRWNP